MLQLRDMYTVKPPRFGDDPRPRGTLLIVDRVEDLLTPFLHDFGYQSMAAELPNMTMFKVRVGSRLCYVLLWFVGLRCVSLGWRSLIVPCI